MPAATVTSKGQITIPAPVRIALGLDAGDRVEFVEIEKGRFAIMPATVPLRRLKGIISKPEKPVSIEQMNTAIAQRRAGTLLKKK
ncbi:MAG TPA: AbrB/MazE/SpoVT family DNA-binding domain-containing protein [Terriglobales bacterium]|jgi:AbrB family looped-hinge helix DNA binding protein|nr:AbrB/MazE/SpoVT family DNA-binding domain-containing protein [Terriglobales bacterium]